MQAKYDKYLSLIKKAQDKDGFIESSHCDSLLLSGLAGCAPGVEVNIDAAHHEDGTWRRRPCDRPCWPEHSKSTISRDMLLGLCWYAYYNKRLDISEGVIKYAFRHCFKMGKGTKLEGFSRIMMTPGLLATFAWVSYKLGGPNRWWLRWIPTVTKGKAVGYRGHLAVLHELLRKKLSGKANNKMLAEYAEYDKQNPLYLYAAGRYEEAEAVLMNAKLFPANELPSTRHRKHPWLPMWESWTDNWKPGKGPIHPHSGGDFLFVAALLMSKI